MDRSKDKIIAAAKELFSQKGYAAVRTKEIASLANVNETTLFRNFKSKKELYDQILISNIKAVDANDNFHKNMTGNIKNDLLNITTQLFMLYQANAQTIKMILKGVIQKSSSQENYSTICRGSHIRNNVFKYFTEMSDRNIIADDPELITELYMNCMNGYLINAFVLDERPANLGELKKLALKIIDAINFP